MSTAPPPAIDLDITKVELDLINRTVQNLDVRIDQSMIDGTIIRTMTGASTLAFVVNDPDRALLHSGMFDYIIEVTLDRFHFRLVQVQKQADDITLTFEDRVVSWLREGNTPRKASRAVMTRAEFVYSLVREVKKGGGIPFFCPELHVTQPIASAKQKVSSSTRRSTKASGVNRNMSALAAKWTATQIRNGERALDVAISLNAPPLAQLALMEACMDESSLQNLSGGTYDSAGILQVRASTAGPMGISNTDIEACCNAFLTRGFYGHGGAIAIARAQPGLTASQIAQMVQGSFDPTGSNYAKYQADAQQFIDAYAGGSAASMTSYSTVIVPYQFQRGGTAAGQSAKAKEDTWDCIQRLAREVNWRCFVSENVCYYVDDPWLIAQKPIMVISEQTPGVVAIDFDIDHGKVKDKLTLHCRASRWFANPGDCVMVEDCGPATGRWLVEELKRSIFDADAEITLNRAQQPLPEPANATKQVAASSSTSSASIAAAALQGDKCAQVYQACQQITAKRYPYVWDGGHAHAGTPDTGAPGPGYTGTTIGYDCSGSVGAVLAAAGLGFRLGDPVPDSGQMQTSWGQPGEGNCLTMWANPTHVFLVVKGQCYTTGNWGYGFDGPALQPGAGHPTSGFTPRHWPGV